MLVPAHHAHVIREHLQWQDREQGIGLWLGPGDDDQIIPVGAQVGIRFRDSNPPPPRTS